VNPRSGSAAHHFALLVLRGALDTFLSQVLCDFSRDERKRSRLIPSPSLDSGNSLCYRTPPAQPAGAKISGRIAQSVEQLTLNQRVPGSSPGAPTNEQAAISIAYFSRGSLTRMPG